MASQPPSAPGPSSSPGRRLYSLMVSSPVTRSAGPSPLPAFNPSVLAALFSDDDFELTVEEIETACANMERDIALGESRQVLVPVRTGPASAASGSVPSSASGLTPPSGNTSGSATPLSDIGAALLQVSEAQRAAAAAEEGAKKKTRRGRRGGKKTQARRAVAIAEGRPAHLPLRRQIALQAHLQAQLAAAQALPRPAGDLRLHLGQLAPAEVLAIAVALRSQVASVHMPSCGILF